MTVERLDVYQKERKGVVEISRDLHVHELCI